MITKEWPGQVVKAFMDRRAQTGSQFKDGAKEALESVAERLGEDKSFLDVFDKTAREYEIPRGAIQMPWGNYVSP